MKEDIATSDPMDATRLEILGHAEDLFAHYGFAKTNVADIAERCKMSPGNLYRYFRNKQAIGIAVTERFFRESETAMAAAMAAADGPEARIRALFVCGARQMTAKMAGTPKLMELVEFVCGEDEPFAVLQFHIGWKRARLEAELETGIAEGLFRPGPVHETALNIFHAVKAFQMPQSLVAWRDPETIAPELEGVLDLIFTGVRNPA